VVGKNCRPGDPERAVEAAASQALNGRSNMPRLRTTTLFAISLLILVSATSFAADGAKGTFHFGNVQFTPVDSMAYLESDVDPPVKIVMLTNFKIDRLAVLEAIDTPGAVIDQTSRSEGGAMLIIRALSPEKCGLSAFLNQAQRQIDLGNSFVAKGVVATPSRAAGECATSKPDKMFDDVYEFRLSYDLPMTAIPKATVLPAGGGEPGAIYAELVKAIKTADWTAAHAKLPPDQVPATKPKASEMKDYFHGLVLNYPKTVKVMNGQVKGSRATINITGTNYEDKKIKGGVAMKKTADGWQVVDQSFYFDE
jgi:hypothetical protein